MLRMGRSPKTELAENRQPGDAGRPQQFNPPPAEPPRAPQARPSETPARPAPVAPETAPTVRRAVTESEALARDMKDGVVSGFVGSGTTVSGDAEFKGMLRIDGHFKGRIRSEKGTLIVSGGGIVDADVEVATARINGTLNGDIVAAERVEFGRSARVRGNIQTPTLVIDEGAFFEGQCRMQQQKAGSSAAPRPAESRPPAGPGVKTQPQVAPPQAVTVGGQ